MPEERELLTIQLMRSVKDDQRSDCGNKVYRTLEKLHLVYSILFGFGLPAIGKVPQSWEECRGDL